MTRIIAALCLLLAAACQQAPRPTNAVLATMTAYEAALTVAVAYNKLPRCSVTSDKLCSDQAVVEQLRKADNAAIASLAAARTVALTPGITDGAVRASLATAAQAVAAFNTIVTIYLPKK